MPKLATWHRRQPEVVQVTATVHFVHGPAVNWLLVTDDTGVMLVDAGYPGDRADVLDSLRQLGYEAADVQAILLTHAHIDHFGSAIWFAKTHSTPVYCHADEVGHAKRAVSGTSVADGCRAAGLAAAVGAMVDARIRNGG